MTRIDPLYAPLLEPLRFKHLTLKNRIIVTAHAPGYAENGMPGERLQTYHVEQAKGGAAMVMFGGSSSVSADGLGSFGMIDVSRDEVIPHFQRFSRRVHDEGAALICQITHMGRRARWDSGLWTAPIAPSVVKEPAHRSYPRVATTEDIARIVTDFGVAALRCKEGGLDGVELAYHAQQLAAQFWSPHINRRTDAYGGSLENRMRFSMEVLREVRRVTGDDFVITVRMSGDELIKDGLSHAECLEIATVLGNSGYVDALNVLGSQAGDWKSAAKSMANMSFPEAPFLHLAAAVRHATGLPVIHAQRIITLAKAAEALRTGAVDLVGMTRAHVADPHFVKKMIAGEGERIRPCIGANYCINRIYAGGEMLCLHNPATGRELTIPQTIQPAAERQRVVVVGAGPAGLEAARVALARGHQVKIFEGSDRLGGQVRVAETAAWRAPLGNVTRWLEGEVRRGGAEVVLQHRPTAGEILAENPDIVVVATGGRPGRMHFSADDPVSTPMETLAALRDGAQSAAAYADKDVLIFDNVGNHKALSLAEVLANAGAHVEVVAPERTIGIEVGSNDMPIHLEHLYARGATFTTDTRLVAVTRAGNRLGAVLQNMYTDAETTRTVDFVFVEDGTLPNDAIFDELRPRASNRGVTDPVALRQNRPQPTGEGGFALFSFGDAVASRGIHAALLDALRVMKDL